MAIDKESSILDIRCGNELREHALRQFPVTIGRETDNDVILSDQMVSRHHARLDQAEGSLNVTDLGSLNGTQVNNRTIEPQTPYYLEDGDTISIGSFTLTLCLVPEESSIENVLIDTSQEEKLQVPDLRGRSSLSIGRGPDSDFVISHPMVSWKHARIAQVGPDGNHTIEDLGSTNGTFVNSERVVRPHPLRRGDIIHIGPYKIVYLPETLEAVDESGNLRLDALRITKTVGKGKNLLTNISLAIQAREFIAIVGGSGAGKSTLLDALNGFRPASDGQVLVNNNDLYSNFHIYRTQLGYVPQKNIIHMELTVHEALNYSARLRLPADTTPEERKQRIAEVLEILNLTECRDRVINKLSGGEQRRVSLAAELLAQPGLLFLDEVTSGLDPGSERRMMNLLRKLAQQGHTILLVTHATRNVLLCDQVVFLAKGGTLAYYGPPQEALGYFNVEDFDDIYDKLQGEQTPEYWAETYRQSEQYQKYIAERLPHTDSSISKLLPTASVADPGATEKRVSALRQFLILSHRNLNILWRDKISMMLMLLIAPIIGILFFAFWSPGIFEPDGGDAMRAVICLFIVAVICFLVGGLVSMREIVKEADIYRRERMVMLKIVPYVLSKVWIAVFIALYSAGVFILFMKLAGQWPTSDQLLAVYFTLTVALLAGMMTGLFISAVSPNPNVSPLLLLLIIIPQVIFGGVMPVKYFGDVGLAIGHMTSTKWTFESLVTTSDMGTCVADDICRQQKCSGANIYYECDFPGVRNDFGTTDDATAVVKAENKIANMNENWGQSFNVNVGAHWVILITITCGMLGLAMAALRWKDRR
jgi:ABC-type multidrug transport system ATPase subunit